MLSGCRKSLKVALILVGVVVVAGLSCDSRAKGDIKEETIQPLRSEEEATIAVFEQAAPSVVFIKNAALRLDWFSATVHEIPQGAGSGFVWDKDGHIVTNLHVIYQANRIEVVLEDQKSYPAEVVGISPDHDLAVLKIDAPNELLKPIKRGRSGNLKVGQKVLAIGNPFGLDYSLSTGVVSALGRSINSITGRKIYDVIQTDAAVNPGSSGGPLLNSSGRLIGVLTAIFSPSGTSTGVSFAIPVDAVNRVVPQLIKYGEIKRAGLGVVLVPDNIRRRLGIEGAIILQKQRNGAADQAGLRATRQSNYGRIKLGDVIIAMDDQPIKSSDDLIEYLDGKKAGQKVDIRFLRDGKEYGTTAILQEL